MSHPARNNPTPEEHYAAYAEYSKTLRTWFVAYGIGAPVVLLSNERVWTALTMSGAARRVGILFLIGVALQVVLAAVNKNAMWACYWAGLNSDARQKRAFKIAERVSDWFWIDMVVDLTTLILFVAATLTVFNVLVAPP